MYLQKQNLAQQKIQYLFAFKHRLQIFMQDEKKLKQLNAKEFIKMRRKQMKNLKTEEKGINTLKELIAPGSLSKFKEAILSENFETVYNFLLNEDEVLRTPLSLMLEEEDWIGYLSSVGEWSCHIIPSPLQKKQQEMKENEFKENIMRTKFLNFNRNVVKKILTMEKESEEIEKLIQVLTQKSSLFEMLYSQFLEMSNILLVIPEERKLQILTNFYLPLSSKLQNQKSKKQIETVIKIGKKEEVWKNQRFQENITQTELLVLEQLSYNFLHQLVLQKEVQKVINTINEVQESMSSLESTENMFCMFDTGNETPIDIILRSWTYEQIKKFFAASQQKECIIMSINCLNKVLKNKKLSQENVEEFICEFLSGEVSSNGYIERTATQNNKKNLQFKNWTNTSITTFEKKKVLMAKQEGSYPLLHYLARFSKTCNLKIVHDLFFKDLQKKPIKKKAISFLQIFGRLSKAFPEYNEGVKEVEDIIYYYQPLVEEICKLPNNETFEYFMGKVYTNFFEMNITRSNQTLYVHPINRHFLTIYTQLHEDLSENEINKRILTQILNCKENEKFIKKFNLYYELLRQYKRYEKLRKSEEWLPVQVKNHLIQYFKNIKPEDLLKQYIVHPQAAQNYSISILAKELEVFFKKEEIIETIKKSEIPYQFFGDKGDNEEMKKKYGPQYEESEEMQFVKSSLKQERYKYVGMMEDLDDPQEEELSQFYSKYQKKKTYENFCNFIEKFIKEKEKAEESFEAAKKLYFPRDEFGFDIAEEKLVEKTNKIILDLNYDFYFKMTKAPVSGTLGLTYSNFTQNIEEPYKAVFDNMIRLKQKTRSASLLSSLARNTDENVQQAYKYIKKLPIEYHKDSLCQIYRYNPNPFFMDIIIHDDELRESVYSQRQSKKDMLVDLAYNLAKDMNKETQYIIENSKMKRNTTQHYEKIRKWFSLFLKISLEAEVGPTSEFLKIAAKHHEEHCNLNEFFQQIPVKFIGFSHCSTFQINVLRVKKNPVQFYNQCKEEYIRLITQEKREQQEEQYDENQHLLNIVLEKRTNSALILCSFFDQLPVDTFKNLVDLSPNQKNAQQQMSKLLQRLSVEEISLAAFDIMIEKELLIDIIKAKIYLKNNCPIYNAAVFAFIDADIKYMISIDHENYVEGYEYPNKCQDKAYDKFLEYFNKMLAYRCIDDKKKIQKIKFILTVLLEEQKWNRLIALLNSFQTENGDLWECLIYTIFELCSSNQERSENYQQAKEYEKMIDKMFEVVERRMAGKFDEKIFKCGFLLKGEKTMQIMKPKELSFLVFAECMKKRPQNAPLMRKYEVAIKEGSYPETSNSEEMKKLNLFPLSPYSHHEFATSPWLIDLLKVEMMIEKKWKESSGADNIAHYSVAFAQKKKTVFMVKEVMDNYDSLYDENEIKNYSGQVFQATNLESIKMVPKAYIEAYFINHKKLKTIQNLQSEKILIQIIDEGYLNFDDMVDVIKCCKMNVFQAYMSRHNFTLDGPTKDRLQAEQLKGKSLIQVLISFDNEKFSLEFIEKYGILNLYESNFKQISGVILRAIAQYRRTSALEYFIEKYKTMSSAEINYSEAMTDEEAFFDATEGVMSLPTDIASLNYFYEYHFLLLSQGIESKKFVASNRFLLQHKSENVDFIPEMKHRLNMLQILSENITKGKDMNFQLEVLLPSTFQVSKMENAKFFKGSWIDSLKNLIKFCVKKEVNLATECTNVNHKPQKKEDMKKVGIFEKILFIVTHPQIKVPEYCFKKEENSIHERFYENQYRLVKEMIRVSELVVKGHEEANFLLENNPQLKDIIFQYNPTFFVENFGAEIIDDPLSYVKGVLVNLITLQNDNEELLRNFIEKCFFESQHNAKNSYLHQNLFKMCLLSKYEGKGIVIQATVDRKGSGSENEVLYSLAMELNKNLDEYIFNAMFWSKVTEDIKFIMKQGQLPGKTGQFEMYISDEEKYKLNYVNMKSELDKITRQLPDIFACITTLLNCTYFFSEQKSIVYYVDLPPEIKNFLFTLCESDEGNNVQALEDTANVRIPYIVTQFSQPVNYLQINNNQVAEMINRYFYLGNISNNDGDINLKGKGLGNLLFKVDTQSFNCVKSLDFLKKMLEQSLMSNDGITLIKRQLQRLESQVKPDIEGIRYSLSDVYGPIAINNQTNKNNVLQAISFYEYCELPTSKILIKYTEKPIENGAKAMIADLREYFRFFKFEINSDQDQNTEPYVFNNMLFIAKKSERDEETSLKVVLDYFHPWNIVSFIESLNAYGMEITRTFENLVNVRFSALSIFKIIEERMHEFQTANDVLKFVYSFINGKNCQKMIEKMLMMVIEDATNIMKVVKGIVINFEYNKDIKPVGEKKPYKLTEDFAIFSIQYQITEQIFSIVLKLGNLPKQLENLQIEDTNIISRKEFLSMIFSSTEFLTDYFLDKSKITQECVSMSREVSKIVNSTTNILINYKSLYNYIEKFKEKVPIKEIDHYLYELRNYIMNNMQKIIINYLNSRQIAAHHQILLLNKFQSLKSDTKTLSKIYGSEQLEFVSKGQNNEPLQEVRGYSSNIAIDHSGVNIKNMFLIQIYKSYFASMVREGMSFILGYKAPNRQPTIIQLQKKEDVDRVNIVELSYMLWVTNRIPTNDEFSTNKIIRVFITDLNRNVYKISDIIQEKLLSLPEESDERNISELAPIIQPNMTLNFTFDGMKETLDEDRQHKYLDMELDEKKKFHIVPRKAKTLSTINYLKRDGLFLQMMEDTLGFLKEMIPSPFKIRVSPPRDADILEINETIKFVLYDIESCLNNIFFEPLRHPQLEAYASIEKDQNLRQNLILRKRKDWFCQNYEAFLIVFVKEGDSAIYVEDNEIKLFITLEKGKKSLTVNDIIGGILDDLVERMYTSSEKIKNAYKIQKTNDNLIKILDTLILSTYQLDVIDEAFKIASQISQLQIPSTYQISVKSGQKGKIRHDNSENAMIIDIKADIPESQFYSSNEIISYLINKNVQIGVNTTTTKFLLNGYIQVENYHQIPEAELVTIMKDGSVQKKAVKIEGADEQVNRGTIKVEENVAQARQYYLLQIYNKEVNVCGNYFYQLPEIPNILKQKKNEGFNNQQYNIVLTSQQSINMTNCAVMIDANIPDKVSEKKNITKPFKDFDLDLTVKLISLEAMIVNFKFKVTCGVTINYGKMKNAFNEALQSSFIDIASSGQIRYENTKFIELVFRTKTHKAKNIFESQHQKKYEVFREPPEKASQEELIEKGGKDAESLVYIVNEQAKKYLTRAGEDRTDVINFCDDSGNPIVYKGEIQIYFKHMNTHEIYKPEITQDGVRVELKWNPIVRGPYEVFFNGIRLNPEYEIGVCAACADVANSKIQTPKVTKLCYSEETECTFELKDTYGNIYTQLEENILGDNLMIDIAAEGVQGNLKVKNNPINKYGTKKVRFSVDDPTGEEEKKVNVVVKLNLQQISEFQLQIKGQALSQRRKNLQKDIDKVCKGYYKDITISRSNFLEGLFKVAQKSLMVNLSIKFAGEQGIDAGGLKREFYDMIGNEIKNQRNPFFKVTDTKRMQYFINPDILKNKKKEEYMNLFGKYLANSLQNGYLIGVSFSPVFIKLLYEDPVEFDDLLSIVSKEESERYKYLLEAGDDLEDACLYFTTVVDKKKGTEIELKEDGKEIPVTKENVNEYLELLSKVLIQDRFKAEINAFREGFNTVFSLDVVRKWIRPQEFWALTAGTKEITPEIVIGYTVFSGGQEMHNSWFRRYIQQSNLEVLVGFLKFSSGSGAIDYYQSSKITVRFEKSGSNPKKLPISHTCWKEIIIPAYKTYDIMKQLLNAAFLFCSEGFGFG